jgi:20S proteasome subunit beta 4
MQLMDMPSMLSSITLPLIDLVKAEADIACRYYCLSILDKHHHPDINYEQGMKILRMCTDELKRRLPIDFKGMLVKVVTKDGMREVEYDDDAVVKSA